MEQNARTQEKQEARSSELKRKKAQLRRFRKAEDLDQLELRSSRKRQNVIRHYKEIENRVAELTHFEKFCKEEDASSENSTKTYDHYFGDLKLQELQEQFKTITSLRERYKELQLKLKAELPLLLKAYNKQKTNFASYALVVKEISQERESVIRELGRQLGQAKKDLSKWNDVLGKFISEGWEGQFKNWDKSCIDFEKSLISAYTVLPRNVMDNYLTSYWEETDREKALHERHMNSSDPNDPYRFKIVLKFVSSLNESSQKIQNLREKLEQEKDAFLQEKQQKREAMYQSVPETLRPALLQEHQKVLNPLEEQFKECVGGFNRTRAIRMAADRELEERPTSSVNIEEFCADFDELAEKFQAALEKGRTNSINRGLLGAFDRKGVSREAFLDALHYLEELLEKERLFIKETRPAHYQALTDQWEQLCQDRQKITLDGEYAPPFMQLFDADRKKFKKALRCQKHSEDDLREWNGFCQGIHERVDLHIKASKAYGELERYTKYNIQMQQTCAKWKRIQGSALLTLDKDWQTKQKKYKQQYQDTLHSKEYNSEQKLLLLEKSLQEEQECYEWQEKVHSVYRDLQVSRNAIIQTEKKHISNEEAGRYDDIFRVQQEADCLYYLEAFVFQEGKESKFEALESRRSEVQELKAWYMQVSSVYDQLEKTANNIFAIEKKYVSESNLQQTNNNYQGLMNDYHQCCLEALQSSKEERASKLADLQQHLDKAQKYFAWYEQVSSVYDQLKEERRFLNTIELENNNRVKQSESSHSQSKRSERYTNRNENRILQEKQQDLQIFLEAFQFEDGKEKKFAALKKRCREACLQAAALAKTKDPKREDFADFAAALAEGTADTDVKMDTSN